MNTNFIASAGTGKTHKLVEKIFEKLLTDKIDINQILALTFTDNAATELRNRVSEKILEYLKDPEISHLDKVHLHRQLLLLDSAYIGTFHTVFLRLLRMFPLHSKIDDSFSILSDQELSDFFDLMFEKWSLEDFAADRESWYNIIDVVGRQDSIKNIFKKIYYNRTKVSFQNQEDYSQLMEQKFEEARHLYEELMEQYRDDLANLWKFNSGLFNIGPHQIKKMLDSRNILLDIPEKILKIDPTGFRENGVINKIQSDYSRYDTIQRNLLQTLRTIKKLKQHQNSVIFLRKFKSFLDFFSGQKQEHRFLDFDDIMERMLDATRNTEIARLLRSRFRYIFVDEFQDTDKTQAEILRLISDDNLYVFGDPKQSIYTWRQADLETYFDFIKDFNHHVMDISHRSTQQLVEFYNALFCGDEFFEDGNIPPEYKQPLKSEKASESSYVKLVEIKTLKSKLYKDEKVQLHARMTAVLINQLLKGGIQPGEIMVLFRQNKDLYQFHKILSGLSVPVYTQANINLYEEPEARFLLHFLKAIDNPNDRFSLLGVLFSVFVDLPEETVYNHRDDLLSINHPVINLILDMSRRKNSLSVIEVVEQIYKEIIFNFNHHSENTLKKFNSLKNTAIIKSKEGYLLKDFILYLENSEEKIKIGSQDNAVKLLTMHSAKGLQSEAVIIPLIDIYPSPPNLEGFYVYQNQPVINIPDYNIKTILLSDEKVENYLKKQKEYEERRLFYVALTRAKSKLVMIATKTENPKEHSLYKIIKSQIHKLEPHLQVVQFEEDHLKEVESFTNLPKQTGVSLHIPAQDRERLLEVYNRAKQTRRFVSVTELMKLETQEDAEIYHQQAVTSEENISLYTGTLVHEVLEGIDFEKFSYQSILQILEQKQNSVPETIREHVIAVARELLKKFEQSQVLEFLKSAEILYRELPFVFLEDGTFVEGRIDLVARKDGTVYVIDYKTNRFSSEEEKQKILKYYTTQKKYYMEAVSRLYPNTDKKFMLGLIYSGELVEID